MADPRLFGEPNRAMVKLRWWRTWVKEPRHMMMRTCALCPRRIFSHWDLENLMGQHAGSFAGSNHCWGHGPFGTQWANVVYVELNLDQS